MLRVLRLVVDTLGDAHSGLLFILILVLFAYAAPQWLSSKADGKQRGDKTKRRGKKKGKKKRARKKLEYP